MNICLDDKTNEFIDVFIMLYVYLIFHICVNKL